ncbi:hypothetical protein CBNA_1155 [Coxiella burnetii str. Namibia]|nr:hypothetical protein CBNA_1155 [Coxiella burnetii str. Namibia]
MDENFLIIILLLLGIGIWGMKKFGSPEIFLNS